MTIQYPESDTCPKKSVLKSSTTVFLARLGAVQIFMTLLLAVLLPYFKSWEGDFVFDDVPLIVEDPLYKGDADPLECWTRGFWNGGQQQGLYRPVTIFTYWLGKQLFGLSSPAFRATNLALHFIVVLLVFKYAVRLRLGRLPALAAALLFAVHPIHTEAVVPAFGRGELLCLLFLLSGLIFHSMKGRPLAWSFAAGASFLLACWSKEHGVVFILLCLLQDIYLRRIRLGRKPNLPGVRLSIPKKYLLYAGVMAVYIASRAAVFGTVFPAKENFEPGIDNVLATVGQPLQAVSAVRLQGVMLAKFFWPAVLSHDYSFAQILPSKSVFDPYAWLTLLLFLGIPAAAARAYPRLRRFCLFMTMAYVVSIIPGGNLVVPAGTILAERLFYLPSLWVSIFCAVVFLRISRFESFWPMLLVFLAAVICLGARTQKRCPEWESERRLAEVGVLTSPHSAKMWNNLAVRYGNGGDFKNAVWACEKAILIYPRYSNAFANKGLYLARSGRHDEAEKALLTAISLHTGNKRAYHNLGALLANQGRSAEAKKVWEESLARWPSQPELRKELEKLDAQMKRMQDRQ